VFALQDLMKFQEDNEYRDMTTTQNNVDLLAKIQSWYASMCNDDWEHTYGIFISNIDNPGWSLKVELKDTYLYDVEFKKVNVQREDENDWIICNVKDGDFQGYGGPGNLSELLRVFLDWAEENELLK
jgi:hypothetical protein